MSTRTHSAATGNGWAGLVPEILKVLLLRVRDDAARMQAVWDQMVGACTAALGDPGRWEAFGWRGDELEALAVARLAAERTGGPFDAVEAALTPGERDRLATAVAYLRRATTAPCWWARLADDDDIRMVAAARPTVRHDAIRRLKLAVGHATLGEARIEVLLGSGEVDVRRLDGIPLQLRGCAGPLPHDDYLTLPGVAEGTDVVDWLLSCLPESGT